MKTAKANPLLQKHFGGSISTAAPVFSIFIIIAFQSGSNKHG